AKNCGAVAQRMISMAAGGNGTPTRSSVTPMRLPLPAITRLSAAHASTHPPGNSVAVDGGNDRRWMGEDRNEHCAQSGQEFADVRRAALKQAHEVDACGKYRSGSGQDHSSRGRQRGKARRQSLAKIQAHGVGLAVGQAQQRNAVSIAEIEKVAR